MSELTLKSVIDLLGKNYFIPSYQRGYRWEKRQVWDMLDDLYKFANDMEKTKDAFYCLQPIVVKKCDTKTITENKLTSDLDNNVWYEVIDGQQRLTTMYILFKYLIQQCKVESMLDEYGVELYQIEYQTVGVSKTVLTFPENANVDSPNSYYITQAFQNISEWFQNLRKKAPAIRNEQTKFLRLITSNKANHGGEGYVQVIWYETEDEDPIKIFTRLNIGKIPLKNAELIKALFLQKRDNSELSKIQQIRIAEEWDNIEAALQDRRLWAFLNEKLTDMPTHIEFIFNLIFSIEKDQKKDELLSSPDYASLPKNERLKKVEKSLEDAYGTDDYATFRFFSEKFECADRDIIKNYWNEVREYYETFYEWYNNPLWYHYIGFLIYCNESIITIYKNYKGKTKREFVDSLVELIRKKLNVVLTNSGDIEMNDKKRTPLDYDKCKDRLRQILVLYNIEYIVRKNTNNDKSYIIFPFDLFKMEKWDIEHVDSFTTNPINDKEQQKEWIKTAISDLEELGVRIEENVKARLNDFILEKETKTTFDDIKLLISRLADEDTLIEENSKDIKNSIGNLTLLNADINRSYGYSIFPTKRKTITKRDSEGRFIPICTKNVFLKNFINGGTGSIAWKLSDMEAYKKNIIEVISKFLIVEPIKEEKNDSEI